VRVFVRWGWVRLLSKAAVCTPVLCCAVLCVGVPLPVGQWLLLLWLLCLEGMCTAFLFPLFLLFSLRALHLHQLTLPPHCWICHTLGSFSCVLGWGSLNLEGPRVFAALLLALFFFVGVCALFFFVGVCAPTCLCKAPHSPRIVCMCVPPELFSCGSGTCLLLCIGGRVSLFLRLGCVCAALCSCVFPCCNGCARGRRGACVFSCVVGWVLCCAWVVVPLPVGLVLLLVCA